MLVLTNLFPTFPTSDETAQYEKLQIILPNNRVSLLFSDQCQFC